MIEKYNSATNRKIRIFISSTFNDMFEERERITHSIFPRLRKEYTKKMVDVVEIDLRWGIPHDIDGDSKVLELCLGEVLKCHPFFLGMVGNRYGYVPDSDEINRLPDSILSTLGEESLHGVSITEMEIRAGVLTPHTPVYASFLLRNTDKITDPAIVALRRKIRSNTVCNTKDYHSIEEFDDITYSLLKEHIDKVYPDIPDIPYNDKTYYTHLNILKTNNLKYIQNPKFTNEVLKSIKESHNILLYGPKGIGKSACISDLIYQIGVVSNKPIFYHYLSAGGDSTSLKHIFNRIYLFLKASFVISQIIPEEEREIFVKEYFSSHTFDEPLYICLDAVELLDENFNSLVLFQELVSLNENVHLICSIVDNVHAWDGDVFIIPRLETIQIIGITEKLLTSRFGKQLDPISQEKLINNPSCQNPLFLLSLLNELRLFGSFEQFDEFFDKISKYETFEDLFSLMYKRLHKYFEEIGKNTIFVDRVFGLLLYSNSGLSENEIMRIMHLPALYWVPIYSVLENYIIEENGLIRINHDLIKTAIYSHLKLAEINICNDGFFERDSRKKLIRYFKTSEIVERVFVELPYQYRWNNNPISLARLLVKVPVFEYLYSNQYHALIGYYSYLHSYQNLILKLLKSYLKQYVEEKLIIQLCHVLCESGCFKLCNNIVSLILPQITDNATYISLLSEMARSHYKLGTGRYKLATKTYSQLIQKYRTVYPSDSVGLCEHLFKYGIVLISKGEPLEALKIYKHVVAVYDKNNIKSGISSWAKGNLAYLLYSKGQGKKSEILYLEAINMRKYIFGPRSSEVAWEYCYYLSLLISLGRYNDAYSIAKDAVEINKLHYNDAGMELAWSLVNYGNILAILNKYDEAFAANERSIELNNKILDAKQRPHPYALTPMNNRACFFFVQGQKDAAERLAREVLSYKIKKMGPNNPRTANTYVTLANILETDEALSYYNEALRIYTLRLGKNTPDYYFTLVCIARKYLELCRFEEAKLNIHLAKKIYDKRLFDKCVIDFLYLETINHINGENNLVNIPQELQIFKDDSLYQVHNNESELIIIPKI